MENTNIMSTEEETDIASTSAAEDGTATWPTTEEDRLVLQQSAHEWTWRALLGALGPAPLLVDAGPGVADLNQGAADLESAMRESGILLPADYVEALARSASSTSGGDREN